jgi:hypothetical protein
MVVLLLAAALMMAPLLAAADEAADLKKKLFMTQIKLVVTENMIFTPEEAAKFWPLFDKYQEKIFANSKQAGDLISAYISVYKTMTEVVALVLIDDHLENQAERVAIIKEFADELKLVLPGQKVFRYLQIENNLDARARFEIAKRLPLAQ